MRGRPFRVLAKSSAGKRRTERAVPISGLRSNCYTSKPMSDERGLIEVVIDDGRFLIFPTGLVLDRITIAIFGMATVFVPSSLKLIGLDLRALTGMSPTLIPVISPDHAGLGGGLCFIGALLLFTARCAELNRWLVKIVAVMAARVPQGRSACTSRWDAWTSFICSRHLPAF